MVARAKTVGMSFVVAKRTEQQKFLLRMDWGGGSVCKVFPV